MKAKDLHKMSLDELGVVLTDELGTQFKLRMQNATGQLKESHKIRQTRRSIARVKTIMTQKVRG
jgi:large subunit ribosomal protein L29